MRVGLPIEFAYRSSAYTFTLSLMVEMLGLPHNRQSDLSTRWCSPAQCGKRLHRTDHNIDRNRRRKGDGGDAGNRWRSKIRRECGQGVVQAGLVLGQSRPVRVLRNCDGLLLVFLAYRLHVAV
jgi:hypothetical protein